MNHEYQHCGLRSVLREHAGGEWPDRQASHSRSRSYPRRAAVVSSGFELGERGNSGTEGGAHPKALQHPGHEEPADILRQHENRGAQGRHSKGG